EKNQGCMHITCTPPCFVLVHGQITGRGQVVFMLVTVMRQQGKRERLMILKGEEKWQRIPSRDIHITMSDGQPISHQGKRRLGICRVCRMIRLEKLSDIQSQPESQLKFIIEAWLQIVECRRVLKWTYAYGYYLPDHEHAKRQFFEYVQGEAESGLERLHQCAEKELQIYLDADCPSKDFNDFRTKLAGLTSVTRNYFENLVRALESGLNDVGAHTGQGACSKAVSSKNLGGKSKSGKNKAPVGASKSGSSTRGMDDGNIWACDQCTFANPRSARSCQVCDHQQHR
uniref:RanBP2-type domain-containing protein n=1 Tax=Aegilops tauschii subsp. strangulata TaxID=200361 RepID=A0A453P1J0_AEGTS